MQIRQFKTIDLQALLDVWELASQVGHAFLSEGFLQSERKNIPAIYLPNGDTWVATIQDRLVGFTILHGNEVGALFVDPSFHGNGVGFELMNKAQALHGQLKVEVFKENAIGNAFYLRYGFLFKNEYLHQQTGMIMSCLEFKKVR